MLAPFAECLVLRKMCNSVCLFVCLFVWGGGGHTFTVSCMHVHTGCPGCDIWQGWEFCLCHTSFTDLGARSHRWQNFVCYNLICGFSVWNLIFKSSAPLVLLLYWPSQNLYRSCLKVSLQVRGSWITRRYKWTDDGVHVFLYFLFWKCNMRYHRISFCDIFGSNLWPIAGHDNM